MNFLNKISRGIFSKESNQSTPAEGVRFSDLIHSIQKGIKESNDSIECVYEEYLKKFFQKSSPQKLIKPLIAKIESIERSLDTGNDELIREVLSELKSDIAHIISDENLNSYRPKKIAFEMPTLKDGKWCTELVSVPSLTISSMFIPKIKELKFTAEVEGLKNENGEVYIRFPNQNRSIFSRRLDKKSNTKIEILLNAEQDVKEINKTIHQYETILVEH